MEIFKNKWVTPGNQLDRKKKKKHLEDRYHNGSVTRGQKVIHLLFNANSRSHV